MSAKSEDATPKRRKKALEDGDAGQSTFFAQSLSFVVITTLLGPLAHAISEGFRSDIGEAVFARDALSFNALWLAKRILALSVPVLAACAGVAGISLYVQTGGTFAGKQLFSPKWEKLNPFEGVKQLFSLNRLVSVVRALALAGLGSWLAYRTLRSALPDLAALTGNAQPVPAVTATLVLRILKPIAWISLGASVLDLAYQKWSWNNRLRMSKDEVKREHKESEGDPQMKAARERAHHEVVAQAVLHNVKSATVVVVNPTHIACALRYLEGEDGAPVVVGSGEGDLAARIIKTAREHGIPILRNIPLARALHEVEMGGEIPEVLFEAVAEILRDLQDDQAPG
jgi:flagellar biosynthesis protein FlhB